MFVYLDHNATTPLAPEVRSAMAGALDSLYGNPSSSHSLGLEARRIREQSRARVAALLGAQPGEIVFTSGGTESDNWVLLQIPRSLAHKGRHVIISAIEHPAVEEPCRILEAEGFRITRLPVDGQGLVDPADLAAALDGETVLVSIMHANNETGTIQPIAALARLARTRGVLFHTDAAQSLGKIPVNVEDLGVDFLTLAGHKLYAPKGVGALYIRKGSEIPPFFHGGGQEGGRRPGTENLLSLLGLGVACDLAREGLTRHAAHTEQCRNRLLMGLEQGGRLWVNGSREHCLPNTLNVSLEGIRAAELLARLGEQLAASAGSACHSASAEPSRVLGALGLPRDRALGALRFSTGWNTSQEDVDQALALILPLWKELREGGSAPG